ncbi:M56 family metallopeptidase [Niallia sp. 01092]|uniref:M56 family metallopeptidase n=1 Tax=unclassified Niallia TaxID=2837522 RepID=UPI003FD1C218
MLPSFWEICLLLFIGILISVLGMLIGKFHKKAGYVVEIVCALGVIAYTFYYYHFPGGFTYIAFMGNGYASFVLLTVGQKKYDELKEELKHNHVQEITLYKDATRIMIDLAITLVILLGGILFLIFGPETSVLKILIAFGFVTVVTEMIKRMLIYSQVKVYFSELTGTLYVLTRLEARKMPINEIKQIQIESSVDLLKLHPLLTLFSSNQDFTTGYEKVLRITFPGEMIYLTMKESEKWKSVFEREISLENPVDKPIEVLPLFHKKNIKRLLGKLYFAVTVKGVSAYSGLMLLLYYLKVSEWIMAAAGVMYWIYNIYISDRVLKAAMDAKETTNLEVKAAAERIFQKAGIPKVKVYETESTQYNGLATGMNIGRAMVTLTTATMKLPMEAIEGILAHEAVHVKKRDVLWSQLINALFLGIMLIFVFSFYKEIRIFVEDHKTFSVFIIWLLMVLFPIYRSFCSQWMEVRADHLGASFLNGGSAQMAEALSTLARKQDEEVNKTIAFSVPEKDRKKPLDTLERESWIWRVLEFQFMPHPPLYWRVQSLKTNQNGWGKGIWYRWFVDRVKECVTR